MDLPPQPPPPPPPATTTVTAHGSEIEKTTRLEANRTGKKRNKLPPPITICYGKCLKNYAARNGRHVLDGCGEFMPSPTGAILECAACGCHRSFHRLEADPFYQVIECQYCYHQYQHQYHHHPPTPPPSCLATAAMAKSSSTPDSESPPPISSSYPAPPHMFFTHNPGLRPPANNTHPSTLAPAVASGSNPKGKKRFRSKFSEHQKEKMQEFAERIGWKMLKTDEEMIVGFCNYIGVTKSVFKVWMHNHKTINNQGNIRNNHQLDQRDNIGNEMGANGSSSSS